MDNRMREQGWSYSYDPSNDGYMLYRIAYMLAGVAMNYWLEVGASRLDSLPRSVL